LHTAMMTVIATTLEILSILAPVLYIILTLIAILSINSPFLDKLASHGKTRFNRHGDGNTASTRGKTQQKQQKDLARQITTKHEYLKSFIHHFSKLQIKKKRFKHFYFIGILWTSVLHYYAHHYYYSNLLLHDTTRNQNKVSLNQFSCLILLYIHLCRRLYECNFVHNWSSNGMMHIAGYIVGVLHYLLLPLIFLSFHDSNEKRSKHNCIDNDSCKDWLDINSRRGVIILTSCIILNLYAQMEQYFHHVILATSMKRKQHQNRKEYNDKNTNQKSRYIIPKGRWFAFISCPHYFFEIVIYISFTIIMSIEDRVSDTSTVYIDMKGNTTLIQSVWGEFANVFINQCSWMIQSNRHFVLVLWVFTNLAISAGNNHKWYHETFETMYPLERKALIPFLW